MTRFTLDSATEFLFGSCVHSLVAGLPYPHNVAPPSSFKDSVRATSLNTFAKALLEAQKVIRNRLRSGPTWPLEDIRYERTCEFMRIVDGYVGPIIQEAWWSGFFNPFLPSSRIRHLRRLIRCLPPIGRRCPAGRRLRRLCPKSFDHVFCRTSSFLL